jgi:hypothetical protein
MKFGVREICDVVLKAKAPQRVGNKQFFKNEPVIYFDTLKTSSMEGAATTVYAQGGRGNSRLIAWEGERTVTFTMEDALISPAGFAILSGAGLIEANSTATIKQHTTEQTDAVVVNGSSVDIYLSEKPFDKAGEDYIYVMVLKDGEVVTEPYIPAHPGDVEAEGEDSDFAGKFKISLQDRDADDIEDDFYDGCIVLVDYYVERAAGAQQIEITPDKFGGNYYLEASTLFRDTNGVDLPAEFIIPNCKIQSNFTFTMASSGDPSTFTFTIDAFPDYLRFDKTHKVLAAIQIIDPVSEDKFVTREREHTREEDDEVNREQTWSPKVLKD